MHCGSLPIILILLNLGIRQILRGLISMFLYLMGFQRSNRVKQARYELEKTTNNLDNLEKVIDFQREAAYTQFKYSVSNLDVQDKNLVLAEKVLLHYQEKI
jgi:outer membrane protein TolC